MVLLKNLKLHIQIQIPQTLIEKEAIKKEIWDFNGKSIEVYEKISHGRESNKNQ